MDSLIYAHHPGQFWSPDSNSKVATKKGKTIFVEIIYDLTYSLPKPFLEYEGQQSCSNLHNHDFDNCYIDVCIAPEILK